jgi:hypothetical protein
MSADPNSLLLGKMSGELGLVMSALKDLSGKVDSLSRDVVGLGPLAADIHEIKTNVAAIEGRIRQLEEKQMQRDGRDGLVALVIKSPAVGWLATAGAVIWAILSGKVHP